jgi:hypothetical protein
MVSSKGGLVDEIKGGEKTHGAHDGITTFSPIKTIEFVRGVVAPPFGGTLSSLNNPLKVW